MVNLKIADLEAPTVRARMGHAYQFAPEETCLNTKALGESLNRPPARGFQAIRWASPDEGKNPAGASGIA